MNIIKIIQKDLPDFSGICLREGDTSIEKVREYGVSLAWKMNVNRARSYKKVLIVGNNANKGKYFIADIISILSIKDTYNSGLREEGIKYQEEIYGKWITERINGVIKDNALEERFAILFENPSEIKEFSSNFSFNRTSLYYINSDVQPLPNIGEYIEINNFGKIQSANIKINGLTVIAGVNDTGKSTAGKILFSIIKATSRYKQDLKESKEYIILNKLEQLYNKLRRTLSYETLREEFQPKVFLEHIKRFVFFDDLDGLLVEEIHELFNYKKKILTANLVVDDVSIDYEKRLDEIKDLLFSKEDKQEQIKRALNRALF
jgi:hypothetical protein